MCCSQALTPLVKRIAFEQQRSALTFATNLQDRHIFTSVILQGRLVRPMVLLGQLQIKHIPCIGKINTTVQNVTQADTFSLQTTDIRDANQEIMQDSGVL